MSFRGAARLLVVAVGVILLAVALSSCTPEVIASRLTHPDSRSHAEELCRIGSRKYLDDEYEKAFQIWKEAEAADPTYVKPVRFLACTYYMQLLQHGMQSEARLAQCRQYINKLLSFDANDPDAYKMLEFIAYSQGKFADSITYANKLITLQPDEKYFYFKEHQVKVNCYFGMAISYAYLGKYSDSLAYLKKFLKEVQPTKYNADCITNAKELIPLLEKRVALQNRVAEMERAAAATTSRVEQPASTPKVERSSLSSTPASRPASRTSVSPKPAVSLPPPSTREENVERTRALPAQTSPAIQPSPARLPAEAETGGSQSEALASAKRELRQLDSEIDQLLSTALAQQMLPL